MAKGQYLSTHQQGIVRRYYSHKETLTLTKLQESVSDLYLAPTDPAGAKAADRKWKWAGKALTELGLDAPTAGRIVESRDPKALAQAVERLQKQHG